MFGQKMAEVNTLTADELKKLFPNMDLYNYRYETESIDITRAILFVAYACLFLVGMAGNGYVACVLANILRLKSAQTPSAIRVFVFALCVCDLCVLSFVPFLLLDLAYNQWAAANWPILCQLYLCSESVNKFCGPFLLVALSAFCYLKICRPNGSSQNFKFSPSLLDEGPSSLRKISSIFQRDTLAPLLVVLVCAALAFSLIIPVYIYGDLYYVVVHNGTDVKLILAKCAFHPTDVVLTSFTVYTFVFGYVLTASAFTIFYVAIVRRVKRQQAIFGGSADQNSQPRRISVQNDSTRPNRLERAAQTCVGFLVFYLACWSPYWAWNLFSYFSTPDESENFTPPSDMEVMAGYFVHLLPYINCAGYPILHAIFNRNIRRDCRRLKDQRMRHRFTLLSVDGDRRSTCNSQYRQMDSQL